MWPVTVSQISGLKSKKGNELEGFVISIPLTAKMMIGNKELALNKIAEAVVLARNKGAKIVAFGALTSSLTKGGELIKPIVSNIFLTTGHAYTALNVYENVESVVNNLNLNKENIVVSVVGAAGSVGSSTAELLVKYGYNNIILQDIARKQDQVIILKNSLVEKYKVGDLVLKISTDMSELKKADIIVTATNATEAIIRNEHVSSGTIIIDDAQPSDVSDEVLEREDVLVLEAGVVYTPGIETKFNLGLKNKNDNFCCMAELLVLSSEEWLDDFVLFRTTTEHVEKIKLMREGLGFRLGDYQNRLKKIDNNHINEFKKYLNKE
jgi:predicted amino acid dehydrogenase